MNLIGFNPMSMYESYLSGKLERTMGLDALGQAYSEYLTSLYAARKWPIVGPVALADATAALAQIKISTLYQQGKIRITIPKGLDNPDLESEFVTIYKEQK